MTNLICLLFRYTVTGLLLKVAQEKKTATPTFILIFQLQYDITFIFTLS